MVADLLGIQRSTYAYYETGKVRPRYKTLLEISNLYGISLRFLLGQSNLQVYRAISREKFIYKEEPYS